MADNIQKLCEIAGVGSVGFNTYTLEDEYPPFTPEKQLELIKWLVKIGLLQIGHSAFGNFQFCNFTHSGDYKAELNEALASFIIQLWNDLTDKQKEEIKEILK